MRRGRVLVGHAGAQLRMVATTTGAHHERTRGDVPGVGVQVEGGVRPAGRNMRETERSAAERARTDPKARVSRPEA